MSESKRISGPYPFLMHIKSNSAFITSTTYIFFFFSVDDFALYFNMKMHHQCYVCMLSHLSCAWLFATLWTIARQAPLSMGFSRQAYWVGCPSLLQGSSSPSDWTPASCGSWIAGCFFTAEQPRSPTNATLLLNLYALLQKYQHLIKSILLLSGWILLFRDCYLLLFQLFPPYWISPKYLQMCSIWVK